MRHPGESNQTTSAMWVQTIKQYKNGNDFSRIIAGEIPSYKVAEDDRYYAFLDINPLTKGHTLVVPKQEVDYIFDLDDDTLAGMMVFAKRWPPKSGAK